MENIHGHKTRCGCYGVVFVAFLKYRNEALDNSDRTDLNAATALTTPNKFNGNLRSRCGPGNAHFISVRQVSLLVKFKYFASY